MHLKRLELQGYKSFATRTEFEFDPGITTIVGPNGSGKSNIADAIRWALGEQSYSLLRAKRTADMIFAGSPQRARLGMAQVTLTLDNADGWLSSSHDDDPTPENLSPADLLLQTSPSEITITRRAYRSGESEYLINGSRVRRRDIIELLAKGGLHRSTYTVIGQGLVDAALSLRPDERRQLLDEAAGIHLYQAQRNNALAKLEETRSNLLRLNDIINEITPRLTRLEKRAQRAREHARISQELEGLLRTWYSYQWQHSQARLQAAKAREAELQQELTRQRARLRELGEGAAQLRLEQEAHQRHLATWRKEQSHLLSRREEVRRELAVSRERAQLLTHQGEELGQEIAALEARLASQRAQIEQQETELARLDRERAELLAQVQITHQQLAEQGQRRGALDEELAWAQERAFQLATDLADRRNRLAQLAERRVDLHREEEEQQRSIAAHEAQIAALDEGLEATQRELSAISGEIEALSASQAEKQRQMEASLKRLDQLGVILEEAQRNLQALMVRWDVLAKIHAGRSGVQAVLDQREQLSGVIGTVADLVQVEPELETAIEAALGPYLQAIVVERWEDAERAIEFLKRTGEGRATFLPLEAIRRTEGTKGTDGTQGVIGLAHEWVDFEERYADLFATLLGRTLIVQDLAKARDMASSSSFRLVTLAGEVIEPHGAISGGSGGAEEGLLALTGERRQLPARIAQAERRLQEIEEQRGEEEKRQRRLEQELANLEGRAQELMGARQAKLEALESQRRQVERLEQEIGWRRAIEVQTQAEIGTLDEKGMGLKGEIAEAEKENARLLALIGSLKEQLANLTAEPLQRQLAELEKRVALADQARASRQAALEGYQTERDQLEAQIAARQERIAELEAETAALERRIAELASQEESLSPQIDALTTRLGQAEEAWQALGQKQRELEEEAARVRDLLQATEARYNQALLEVKRAEDRLAGLRGQLEADWEALAPSLPRQLPLDLAELPPPPPVAQVPAGLERRIRQLKAQLRSLGAVDPQVLAEYEETRERHTFLTAQIDDLQRAARDLHQVIAELDRLMAQRFQETFSAVAAAFEHYFTMLFGGGTAQLVLTEAEDPTESGVDIIARPPGRRSQSLALLSGGERAITAVALIFALLKVSPTPFCLLDEVDATLDEANIRRFREVLQELSRDIQFIVITHNRGTIETAEAIYGVSMGPDGVSQVISLKPDEIAA
ncbi:MAG: chromosome segregation protein SMC [Anaerolineae bacterium]